MKKLEEGEIEFPRGSYVLRQAINLVQWNWYNLNMKDFYLEEHIFLKIRLLRDL